MTRELGGRDILPDDYDLLIVLDELNIESPNSRQF